MSVHRLAQFALARLLDGTDEIGARGVNDDINSSAEMRLRLLHRVNRLRGASDIEPRTECAGAIRPNEVLDAVGVTRSDGHVVPGGKCFGGNCPPEPRRAAG